MFLFISTPEIVFILVIVLMLFGADKIPDIAREAGKGMRQIRNATNQIKHEIQQSGQQNIDISSVEKVKQDIESIKNDFEETEKRIKRQL